MHEHDYLKLIIDLDYKSDLELQVDSFHPQIWEALKRGDRLLAFELEEDRDCIQQQIWERYLRRQDILMWLRFDDALRREKNTTYPNYYENLDTKHH